VAGRDEVGRDLSRGQDDFAVDWRRRKDGGGGAAAARCARTKSAMGASFEEMHLSGPDRSHEAGSQRFFWFIKFSPACENLRLLAADEL